MSETRFLTFRTRGGRCAIPLDRVREAARLRVLAPLPGAPPAYRGVALVRGEPLGVVDVGIALGDESSARPPDGDGPRMLIVVEGEPHALLVDAIDGFELIPEERQTPAPPGTGRVAGLVAEGDRTLRILDLGQLLARGTT